MTRQKLKEPRLTHQSYKVLNAFMEDIYRELSGSDLLEITSLASGTLYPILMRLEQAGWLNSKWENVDPTKVGRPRRRLYKITGTGVRCFSANRAELFGALQA